MSVLEDPDRLAPMSPAQRPAVPMSAGGSRQAVAIPRGRIDEIEALRAIAILLVMVEHSPINLLYWGGPLTMALWHYGKGWTGVDLFFAISGFVITRGLLPKIDATPVREALPLLVRFWIRRAWRLFPSAWLWLVIILLLSIFLNHSGAFRSVTANVETDLSAFLDLENFHEAEVLGSRDTGIAFPYWSLSLEEQFYLVLPILLIVLRGWILLPIALAVLSTLQYPTPLVMMTRSGALALGVGLALWERRSPDSHLDCMPAGLARHRAARIATLVALIASLVAIGSEEIKVVSFRLLPVSLISALLVWLAAYDRGLVWQAGTSRRVMVWIGERSYALYLLHVPVYMTTRELFIRCFPHVDRPHGVVQVAYYAVAYGACFLIADLNYRLVETPLRARGQRLAAAWRPGRLQERELVR